MISQTQHANQGDAPALDAASNDGADPIRLIPDLDRPGLPQCGEPGRPHVWHLSSAIRSRAAACVVASHWPKKLSPTVQRRCEVINCTRAIEAHTRTRGPVLADRASGGFGKLLTALERSVGVQGVTHIKTFSDNQVSDGALYSRLGFRLDGEVPPDYTYFRGRGERQHKFNYRLARFRDDPSLTFKDGLTELELARLNNLHRVWDAGKRRWVKEVRGGLGG